MKAFVRFTLLFTALSVASSAQTQTSIMVGAISNGVPVLTKTDAELTSALSPVLHGATLAHSTIKTAMDSLGQYYYIRSEASRSGQPNASRIVAILFQNGTDLQFVMRGDHAGCTMECVPNLRCPGCDQVIFDRCKSQRCTCNSPGGGSKARVTFPD